MPLKNKYSAILYAILSLLFCYFVFGFYYERYEPLLIALLSGFFTPDMVYDDLFYLAHIGLAKIYGNLYSTFPNTPWLNMFQYFYLIIGYVLIVNLLSKQVKNYKLFILVLLLFSIFYMEFYVLHVMTRISYLLSAIALLKIIYNFKEEKRTLKSNLAYLLLFGLAVLIRFEPAAVVLLLIVVYYSLVLNKEPLVKNIKSTIYIFLIPTMMCILAMLWLIISIKTSDEFYIKIEPDVEYELAARNNIVPIETMKNAVDSMRYQAIYMGIWGDATTNDDLFLRSLIADKEKKFKHLANNSINGIIESAVGCKPIIALNSILFLLLFGTMLFKNTNKAFKLVLFQTFFYFIIFLFGYKVKMIVTSLSPIMFIFSTAYLILLFEENQNQNPTAFIIIALTMFVYQFNFLLKTSMLKHKEYVERRKVITLIENSFENTNIFLDEASIEFFLHGFKPFQKIEVKNIENIYIFDYQHTSTIQPYKTFLSKDCSCDPNNYKEYFNFLLTEKEKNIFFVERSKAEFLERYLSIVHNTNTNWKSLSYGKNYQKEMKAISDCDFFVLE